MISSSQGTVKTAQSDRPFLHPHPLRGLLIAQFCGAFNDNAWKLLVALLALRQVAAKAGGASSQALEAASQAETTLVFVVFTLPLMVGSLFAGTLADRLSKRTVIIAMKIAEVGLMTLGTFALLIHPQGGWLALAILAGMGAQSALFSPAKYGILPEVISHPQLSEGNGTLELWTFLAIIAGTAAGGLLLTLADPSPWLVGLTLTVTALIGLTASFSVPSVPPARREGGVRATLAAAWEVLQHDRTLRVGMVGAISFWTIASLVGQDILIYGKTVLGLADSTTGLPLATFGIGIGLGALLAGKLSESKVESGLIPLGAIGISFWLFFIGIGEPKLGGTLFSMGVLGIASGFVVVPLNAIIQWRPPGNRRGGVIALTNTAVFSGILLGSLSAGGFSQGGLNSSDILAMAGFLTLIATLWLLLQVPTVFIRCLFVVSTHTVFRLEVMGRDAIPERGGAIFLSNDVSWFEGLSLQASLDRPVHILVDQSEDHHPFLGWLSCILKPILVSSADGPQQIKEKILKPLEAGEFIWLVGEGPFINRTRQWLDDVSAVAADRTYPIIPAYLGNIWGSLFSFIGGRLRFKFPERFPYDVPIIYGSPIPPATPFHTIGQVMQDLREVCCQRQTCTRQPLHHSFIGAVRRHPFRFVFGDATRPSVSSIQALAGAVALARILWPNWKAQETIGILLPPSVAGSLVNIAATLTGRTCVNLNYTAGRRTMEAAITQARLRTIVSSRLFLRKANIDLPEKAEMIWLEDLRDCIGTPQKIAAMGLALFCPIKWLEKVCGAQGHSTVDDLATIIFSSGSTGDPKGVMLSHLSIDANLQGVAQRLPVDSQDRLLGILPFFHSFGYLATLWFPALYGAGVFYHPSPLDTEAIGEVVHKQKVTILLATPTFLQLYARRCQPEQFRSLRLVLTGAEKLLDRAARAFEDRFGLRPIEGYGVTECAPVISVNCSDAHAAGFSHPVSRSGTVGLPLPNVSVCIASPDTFEQLPIGAQGMLLVKGPNVMNGYLGRADLTAQVMRNGWYLTGDIARIDEDGFITITDRLSRFSKIGGEMVPHGQIEEALHQAAGVDTQHLAVTAVPDDRKGEQLVVLHTFAEEVIPMILEKLAASGLPKLFIPRRDRFIKVEAIPVLGTGKLDLRTIKRIAYERFARQHDIHSS